MTEFSFDFFGNAEENEALEETFYNFYKDIFKISQIITD